MKFRYIAMMGFVAFALASTQLLPVIFSHLKSTPEISYYINHPDLTYSIFSECKLRVDDADRCYAAYSAGIFLADSTDCSLTGIEFRRRFKRLVEHSKNDTITEEITSDCGAKRTQSLIERWISGGDVR